MKRSNGWKKALSDFFSGWMWKSLVFPFLCTRGIWLLIGLLSVNFAANPTYAEYAQRGWFLSPHWLIDIWTRWDAKWYLTIIEGGYSAPADLTNTISNIAFFPLYSYIIKAVVWLFPNALVSRSLILLVGLLLSNLAFLLAGGLVYRLAARLFDDQTAHRTLQLYFVFPTAFIFSAFYTESLFLLLAAAMFILAEQKRWLVAGLLAGLLALARPQGVLICLPLLVGYMESIQWQFRMVKVNILVMFIPLAALLGHLLSIFPLTGSLAAPMLAQKSWGKLGGGYLEALWTQIGAPALDVFKFDLFFLLLFLFSAIWIFFKFPSKTYGLFAFLMVLMPVLAGSVVSVSRYVLVAFPVFIFWADRIKNQSLFDAVRAGLLPFRWSFSSAGQIIIGLPEPGCVDYSVLVELLDHWRNDAVLANIDQSHIC